MVKFVAVQVHLAGGMGERYGFQVRGDVFLPETEPGEDVTGHMNGVCGGRRNRRITAGGFQAHGRQLRSVAGMNDVVRESEQRVP
jgi:hypothetical protein